MQLVRRPFAARAAIASRPAATTSGSYASTIRSSSVRSIARHEQHRVPGGQRGEVGDDRLDVVRAGDEHEPPLVGPQQRDGLLDACGQLPIAETPHRRGRSAPAHRRSGRGRGEGNAAADGRRGNSECHTREWYGIRRA